MTISSEIGESDNSIYQVKLKANLGNGINGNIAIA